MEKEQQDTENEEFTSPHLPERYQKVVKAKQQRRLMRRILLAGVVLVVVVILGLLFSGTFAGIFSKIPALPSPATGPAVTATTLSAADAGTVPANTSGDFTRGPGLTAPLPSGVIPLDRAIVSLRSDYPAADYSILTADLTSRANRTLFAFSIQPKGTEGSTATTVYVDAATGNSYSPGEEAARIIRDDAKRRARAAVPGLTPDRVILAYSGKPGTVKTWAFTLWSGSIKLATGTLDAETGEVISFEKVIRAEGRPKAPSIDSVRAEAIADRYIIDQNNGQLPLNLSVSRYETINSAAGPVAGQYTLIYERMYQDYLTDVDGFIVIVDGVTGEVTGYTQHWTTPDHAFAAVGSLDTVKREATFAVLQKAKAQYPESVNSLQVVSANIRWKNDIPYGTVPRPGSIPLGWKVVFDDDFIRANASATKGVAWVDVQSGEFIAFEYKH